MKESAKLRLKGAAWLALALTLSACGGGGGNGNGGDGGGGDGGGTPPPTGVTLKGVAIANNVSGANVTVFSVKADGSNGPSLGTATTDTSGNFSVSLASAPTGGVRIAVSGGSYKSEADVGKTVTGTKLSTLVSAVGADPVAVTPLTTFSDANASATLGKGGSVTLPGAVTAGDKAIAKVYGLPDDSLLSSLLPDFTASTGAAAQVALVLGTLEQLATRTGKTPQDVIVAVGSDLSDGVPDGKAADGSAIKYDDGTPAPNTLANTDLLSALNDYLGSSNTVLAQNQTTLDSSVVSTTRGAVVAVSPSNAAVNIGTSGAITARAIGGKQYVLLAARSQGLQQLDVTDPEHPVVSGLSTLNAALEALTPRFSSVDGVLAVPGQDTQVALFNYDYARIVIVDFASQAVVANVDLSSGLKTRTYFSGGSAYISGGITDYTRNLLWLATGDGYYPYCLGASSDARYCPTGSSGAVGTPIALAANQMIAENIGAATDAGNALLFSPNYGDQGSGGGLQIADLTTGKAYALADDQFQSLLSAPNAGGYAPFGIADSGGFDSQYHVGVMSGEDVSYVAFLNLADRSKLVLDDATGTFSLADPAIAKTINLNDDPSNYQYYELSGAAVDSSTHLTLMMAGYSNDLLVGKLDNPSAPANGTWAGFTGWKHWSANYSEFSPAGDPHAVGALLGSNGKSYGFMLSGNRAVIMIDLQAFLDAATVSPTSHELATTPFDGAIIKTLPLGSASASAKKAPVRSPQRRYGMTSKGS
jgi:hypothetical protein